MNIKGDIRRPKGLAALNREERQRISSLGGKAAHARGTAHKWTPEQAREAGRKGGTISRGGRGRAVPPSVGADVPGGGAI